MGKKLGIGIGNWAKIVIEVSIPVVTSISVVAAVTALTFTLDAQITDKQEQSLETSLISKIASISNYSPPDPDQEVGAVRPTAEDFDGLTQLEYYELASRFETGRQADWAKLEDPWLLATKSPVSADNIERTIIGVKDGQLILSEAQKRLGERLRDLETVITQTPGKAIQIPLLNAKVSSLAADIEKTNTEVNRLANQISSLNNTIIAALSGVIIALLGSGWVGYVMVHRAKK